MSVSHLQVEGNTTETGGGGGGAGVQIGGVGGAVLCGCCLVTHVMGSPHRLSSSCRRGECRRQQARCPHPLLRLLSQSAKPALQRHWLLGSVPAGSSTKVQVSFSPHVLPHCRGPSRRRLAGPWRCQAAQPARAASDWPHWQRIGNAEEQVGENLTVPQLVLFVKSWSTAERGRKRRRQM